MILDYINFLTENKDNINKDRKQKIADFNNFNNRNYKFIESLYGGPSVSKEEVISKYFDLSDFRNQAEYLRKEPKYVPLFFKIKEFDGRSDEELRELYSDIQKHRNTIRQNKVDLTKCNTYEDVVDELLKLELIERTNRYTRGITNPLRSMIRSDKDIMERLGNMLIGYNDYDDYRKNFLRKVDMYRTPEEFLNGLNSHIATLQGMSKIVKDIKNTTGAEIISMEDNIVIARIYSREASVSLGSQQWCISNRGGSMWDSYISNRNGYGNRYNPRPGVQYFIWDFNYEPSDHRSMIGATVYLGGNMVAHDKPDNKISIQDRPWVDYLQSFDELDTKDKIMLIASNPDISEYDDTINRLSELKKRALLDEVPRLLLYFDDLGFLSNSEIWSLVTRDISLSENEAIARELNDEQKIKLVITNPDLLEKRWSGNPYLGIVLKITRDQRIEMISNKHSLFTKFNLNEDEILRLIKIDPSIMVSHTDSVRKINQVKLREEYLKDKKRWDDVISNTRGEKKAEVSLLLQHLSKDEERLKMEQVKTCYVLAGEPVKGNRVKLYRNGILRVKNTLTPDNPKLSDIIHHVHSDNKSEMYRVWLPNDLIDESLIRLEELIFESNINDLINGNATNSNEQYIYDTIINEMTQL